MGLSELADRPAGLLAYGQKRALEMALVLALVVFGILVVPLGVVSITLIVLQPIAVGAWCTPCLIAAAAMLVMISLTLDEVVRRTLLNSPQVVQAQGAVQTAGASELTAVGAFLPNLSVSSGAALSSTQRFDPNTNTNVTGSSDSSR